MIDFTNILNKNADSIEKPKPVPEGLYQASYQTVPEFETFEAKDGREVPVARFKFTLISASGVDPSVLAEYGGGESIPGRVLNHTFYLEEDSLWRLIQFLTNDCAISSEGKTIMQLVEEGIGTEFSLDVFHKIAGDAVFANVKATYPA